MWDFDKKKMWGVKPHIGIGTMKKMSNLICGKFTAGRNYNLTLNTVAVLVGLVVAVAFLRNFTGVVLGTGCIFE